MPDVGFLNVRAYTSKARIPLKDVSITIISGDGTTLALRLTDRSGRIKPIPIPVPELSESQEPDPMEIPYTTVNLYAHLKNYEQISAEGIQIFADTTTNQDLEMIPLSEFPNNFDKSINYQTPPQNL